MLITNILWQLFQAWGHLSLFVFFKYDMGKKNHLESLVFLVFQWKKKTKENHEFPIRPFCYRCESPKADCSQILLVRTLKRNPAPQHTAVWCEHQTHSMSDFNQSDKEALLKPTCTECCQISRTAAKASINRISPLDMLLSSMQKSTMQHQHMLLQQHHLKPKDRERPLAL